MVFRFDVWPLTTVSMFSESANARDIQSYQLYFSPPGGEPRQVPILCGKFSIYLLDKNLGVNPLVVERVIRAMPEFANHVVPAGPGTLTLTMSRLQKDGKVLKDTKATLILPGGGGP